MVWGIMITVGLHILCARRLFDFMADNYLELPGKRSIYNERKEKQIHQEFLTGERALFASNDLDIYDTIFDDGESPLKESHGISLTGCFF